MIRILFALAVLGLTTMSASAQTRVFQGTAFLVALSSGCDPALFAVGNYFNHVFRQKATSSDSAEAMSFHTERNVFRIVSNDTTGTLQGAVATTNLYVSSKSNFVGSLAGNSNLAITSSAGAALTAANSLKYFGTVDNFFGNAGCTVTVRAVGVLRPDL